MKPNCRLLSTFLATIIWLRFAVAQLPDDIQSELDASLREQARIQQMREQQQKLIRNRSDANQQPANQHQHQQQQQQKPFDPNNYSFQQVSPPVQYSYYQPYGDAAQTSQQPQPSTPTSGTQQAQPKMDFNIDTLNFELPKPEARVASGSGDSANPRVVSPQFTGVGGLPVGNAPLAPQAQQGPPLTEADFKDITGGENYGAPAGDDFGIGSVAGNENRPAKPRSSSNPMNGGDMSDFNPFQGPKQQQNSNSRNTMDIPDFGSFGLGGGGGQGNSLNHRRGSSNRRQQANDFGNLEALAGGPQSMGGGGGDGFDSFASQPQGDQAAASGGGGGGADSNAPGSLQTLLGAGFPGLSADQSGAAWDPMGSSKNGRSGSQQSSGDNFDQVTGVNGAGGDDVGSLDIADLGDKSDQFSGANLGTFEQPGPQNDQDFNLGAAASNNQPKSVPYPDENPQFVGTLWALTQPQSMSQTRYNAQIDKGTYQDYPAYHVGDNDFGRVSGVVDATPKARAPGAGRYATPSARALAPEVRSGLRNGQHYDYSQAPSIRAAALSSLI